MKKKLSLILAILLITTTLGCALPGVAFAATTEVAVTNYTNVLDDLSKDESFDAAAYPEKPGDYGLEVFQIAESSDGELFVYVYQHCDDTRCLATTIRFSPYVSGSANFSPHDYDLQLLNSEGTLAKYIVLDFEVKKDVQRCYEIIQITRKWIKGYDDEALGGNTVNERAYAVSKLFTATTTDNGVLYTEEHADVLEIKNLYTGNLIYTGGVYINGVLFGATEYGVSHYVAFSTDARIDSIEEATVGYYIQDWSYEEWNWNILFEGVNKDKYVYTDPVSNEELVLAKKATVSSGSVFRHEYSFDRIQDSDSFITSNANLSDAAVARIEKMQWVLCFKETAVSTNVGTFKSTATGQHVSHVTVLRLKYWAEGKPFDMGVVSNVQTGSGHDNLTGWEAFVKSWNDFWDSVSDFFNRIGAWCAEYWWVLVIIGVVIFLGLFGWLLKPFSKALLVGLKWIGLGLYYVISAPARLIVFIAEKIKEKQELKG